MEDIFVEILNSKIKFLFNCINWQWGVTHSKYFVIVCYLIFIGLVFPLYRKIKNFISYRYNKQILYKNLKQYYSEFEIDQALKFFIESKSMDHDPSEYLEYKDVKNHVSKRKKIINVFISIFKNSDNSRKIHLVLADSGMGKTTFLINLFLRYYKKTILFHEKFEIKVIPFGHKDFDKILKKYSEDENSVNTILLLDAFDEDIHSYNNPSKRFEEIIELSSSFQHVIITCRTQFFNSISDIPTNSKFTSFGPSKKKQEVSRYFLSPFFDKEVSQYINKKYPFWEYEKRNKAKNIISNCPNLMARPMLLNYIDDLLEKEKEYTLNAEIYNDLVWSWIERERNIAADELYKCSLSMAINMYNNRNNRKGYYIPSAEIGAFKIITSLNLSDIEIRSKSLLNSFEGKYKFSHKSILEYFLADNCLKNIELNSINVDSFENPYSMDGLTEAARFHDEIFILKITIPYLSEFANLNLTPKQVITSVNLDLSKSKINSLVFLKGFKKLQYLDISKTRASDLTPLIKLKDLKEIKAFGSILARKDSRERITKDPIEEFRKYRPEVVIKY